MMKKISIELMETKLPYNNKTYFDSISLNSKENYLYLYSLYSDLLVKYFIKKYDLNIYDNMLKNSNRNLSPIDSEEMDIYQYTSSDYLSYLYIRNNIVLENLSNEEIITLSNFNNNELDKEKESFIEKTYKKVIFSQGYTMYGSNNSKYLKDSSDLIIGLRYKEYEENKIDQRTYLDLFIPELERQLNSRNLDNISVIEYNSYNIKSINKKR